MKDPRQQVTLPKTAPVPGLKAYRDAIAAEAAAWEKQLATYETAKAKAEAEDQPAPKAPVRIPQKTEDGDLRWPVPVEATDADLLRLKDLLGDACQEIFQQGDERTCQVAPEAILQALNLMRDDAELRYEMLADETATHYPAGQGFAFSVVYHLTSIARKKRLRLRILIAEGFEPESATQVYAGANWMEREIFDMLGIRFANHPDMTRILCPDDWEAHALRKEYPVVGLGQRDIDFREDRSGWLNQKAIEVAGHLQVNLNPPRAD